MPVPIKVLRETLIRIAAFTLLSMVVSALSALASSSDRHELILTGDKLSPHVNLDCKTIYTDSDSLFINSRLLKRSDDYLLLSFPARIQIKFSMDKESDTLRIIYRAAPDWLKESYGWIVIESVNDLPAASNYPGLIADQNKTTGKSTVQIAGSKSFRFESRSTGTSDFGQTIDLSLSGELSPGLRIKGSVTDRGVDPSYGTANSRLSELDKVNLTLESKRMLARVGDISVSNRLAGSYGFSRAVSGAALDLNGPNWYLEAAAARSKGRFETVRLIGQDGVQGPYRITSGGLTVPVVPGSEEVWLDGEKLERGAINDYTIDYPTGRITFGPQHSIDSRSRFEIDFQPQTTKFKQEYLSLGGGLNLNDSLLFFAVGMSREGDDQSQPLTGELTIAEKTALQSAGDSTSNLYRTGVTVDSLGNYSREILPPNDTIYNYEGPGNGDYLITFNYVSPGSGDYKFIGGEVYEYAGLGQGEYLPVVPIVAPERIDYLAARAGLNGGRSGSLLFDIKQSYHDKNLLSDLQDNNNDGLYLSASYKNRWNINGYENEFRFSAVNREKEYRESGRSLDPDLARRFLAPNTSDASKDIKLYRLDNTFRPIELVAAKTFYSEYRLSNNFLSRIGGVSLELHPIKNVTAKSYWSTINAAYDSASFNRHGDGKLSGGSLLWSGKDNISVLVGTDYDKRENNYSNFEKGTRFFRYHSQLTYRSSLLSFERFDEDTLVADWRDNLKRNRLSFSSSGHIKALSYKLITSYQEVERPEGTGEAVIGRVDYRYNQSRLSLAGTYALSEERRNARSIVYLEVEPGSGDYIFVDSQYVPDPDGNFIRVEELISEQNDIRGGEKAFNLSRDFGAVLIRFRSNIKEELLEAGERDLLWVLPFYSDKNQSYLFYSRRYDFDIRIMPLSSGYFLTLLLNEDIESRDLTGTVRQRNDRRGSSTFRQIVNKIYFEESLELFSNDRDNYYAGSGSFSGYKLSTTVTSQIAAHTLTLGGQFRKASTDASSSVDQQSQTYIANSKLIFRLLKRSEFRFEVELYSQKLKGISGTPSYTLTENRPGEKGADWQLALRQRFGKDMRLDFSLNGRHADNRTARVTARGEFIAEF